MLFQHTLTTTSHAGWLRNGTTSRVQQGDGQQIRKSVYTGKMHLQCGGTGTCLQMENGRGSVRKVFQEEASQHRSPTAGPHSGRIGNLGQKFFTQD